jgi:hypothetical protein
MSIIYTVITKNFKSVLCEFTEYNGNFEQISPLILSEQEKNFCLKKVIDYDDYTFYLINKNLCIDHQNLNNGFYINIMCLVNKENKPSKNIIFEYLTDLFNKLVKDNSIESLQTCRAYSLENFNEVLKTMMMKFNKTIEKNKRIETINNDNNDNDFGIFLLKIRKF